MGIPYYFYTLTKSYNNIISSRLPEKHCDIYCLDFNGVIHPICAKMLADVAGALDDAAFEEKLIEALYQKVLGDIELLKPKKVCICVDGVVPLAKMMQQRKRRYLTVYRNRIDGIQVKWDTNAITPGTKFMKKLNTYFKKQIRYNSTQTDIYFSGSDEYGEGEHKIFDCLKSAASTDNIIINGLDADLIILSLMSHHSNITLMRENPDSQYLDINNLRSAVIKKLTGKWDVASSVEKDVIESYCVLCSLLGNDFIPHLLTLNLHNKSDNALGKLVTFAGMAFKTYGLLVQDGVINYEALTDILQNIAKTEDRDIFEETERYIKRTPQYADKQNKSDYYGLKNKHPVAQAIYGNISKWRHLYYKHLFNTNTMIDSSVINTACNHYIRGIYWTYAYYKKAGYDHLWYYPYSYPPSIRDIANYAVGSSAPDVPDAYIQSASDITLDTKIQTLIVLPKESMGVVDDKPDIGGALQYLYPVRYNIHTYLKTHLWECAPDLPTINVKHIKNVIKNIIKK
jgi:5'-3' exonuclease